jgi:hypothetical protein
MSTIDTAVDTALEDAVIDLLDSSSLGVRRDEIRITL